MMIEIKEWCSMKKYYETPSAEKIAFNYRDQVVAASGANGDTNSGSGGTNYNQRYGECFTEEDVFEDFMNFFFGICNL